MMNELHAGGKTYRRRDTLIPQQPYLIHINRRCHFHHARTVELAPMRCLARGVSMSADTRFLWFVYVGFYDLNALWRQ